jgi:AraC-like DNA-binding protein
LLASLTTGKSVREVLATLPLSYRQLARYCQAATGHSPKQLQLQARLEVARTLLADSSRSITTIALELGFPSSQHFATQFRRVTGQTPGAFRQQATGEK